MINNTHSTISTNSSDCVRGNVLFIALIVYSNFIIEASEKIFKLYLTRINTTPLYLCFCPVRMNASQLNHPDLNQMINNKIQITKIQ